MPNWIDEVDAEIEASGGAEALLGSVVRLHTNIGKAKSEQLVLTVEQLHAKASAVRWAVKGLIAQQSLGFIFGASGTFKSFIALDYALHRAYGMKWLGRRTTKAVPLYLAAEGGSGLIRRIQAWHQARGMDWRMCQMRVVIVPLTLRTEAGTLRQSLQALQIDPGDVIVDTMSQTFTGNENSNDEVAEWLRVLGTELRDGLKATVLVVHHTGHVATERPRGASAIIANIDFAFGVFRDENEMLATVDFMKVKDGERPTAESFSLNRVELEKDEDGDPITSLAAKHMSTSEEVQEAMAREAQAGRGGRNHLLMSLAQNGQEEKALRKAFYEDVALTDPEAKKKAFYRAREWAIKNGHMEIAEGYVLLLKGMKK